VASIDSGVRPLELTDLDWILDLSARRRERLARSAPTFFRPALEARSRHREFLRHQLRDHGVVSLRTDRGFVVAAPRDRLLDVDDLVLEDDALWSHDGAALLRAVNGSGDLRFTCPVPESARRRAARDLGMELAESWWHRDLVAAPATPAGEAVLDLPGAAGRLVAAPPVYDPGGPVLLVSAVDDSSALAAIEAAAAARGAVVSVVTRTPAQPTDLLAATGYARTTDFYVSRRSVAGRVTG